MAFARQRCDEARLRLGLTSYATLPRRWPADVFVPGCSDLTIPQPHQYIVESKGYRNRQCAVGVLPPQDDNGTAGNTGYTYVITIQQTAMTYLPS